MDYLSMGSDAFTLLSLVKDDYVVALLFFRSFNISINNISFSRVELWEVFHVFYYINSYSRYFKIIVKVYVNRYFIF